MHLTPAWREFAHQGARVAAIAAAIATAALLLLHDVLAADQIRRGPRVALIVTAAVPGALLAFLVILRFMALR